MALASCRECGKEVSSSAPLCPHCGVKRPVFSPARYVVWAAIGGLALWGLAIFNDRKPSRLGDDVVSLSAPAAAACSAANFTVSKEKAVSDGDYATLTGFVRHNCPGAAGVKLRWTVTNSDGTVAFSDSFWPASTTNIAPNIDYPFETMNRAPRGKWRYTVVPESINEW